MDKSIRINDLIMLREDIPQHDLRAGRMGYIRQVLPSGEVEVEFYAPHGPSVAKIPLRLEQIRILRYEATLDAAGFWKLIENARVHSGGDVLRYRELARESFINLSVADIFAFRTIFYLYHDLADRQDVWKAVAILNSYFDSESGFWEGRNWLIEQGEVIYTAALRDPESLIDVLEAKFISDVPEGYEFDIQFVSLAGVLTEAYEMKTGEEDSVYGQFPFSYEDCGIDTSIVQRPDDEEVYWELEEAIQKYPKLAAKFRPNYKPDNLE